ncbi:MAG: DUF1552 domain-containing protein, partial [Nevskiales bacterium]|nr:DUF1552 domain-containing protein [Nevskiales bacterium]
MKTPSLPRASSPFFRPGTRALSRRTFLRAAGVGLSLPLLEAMQPVFASTAPAAPPRRMVLINKTLGLYAPDLFPKKTGRGFELTPYLQELAGGSSRITASDFTVFSGLSHPQAGGGHTSEASFLTAAPHSGTPAFRNTVSLDQRVAPRIGAQTRYPFLALSTNKLSASWTRNGVQVPPDKDPAVVFRRLFVTGTSEEIREQEQQLRDGHSILDTVRAETVALQSRVGAGDRERLDQYFSAVREVEGRLKSAEAWLRRSKPKVEANPPEEYPDSADVVGRTQMLFDLVHLALQTDSTRLVTLAIDAAQIGVPPVPGVDESGHNLSHHGQDPAKIKKLRILERAELKVLHGFLTKFKESPEAGSSLLDRTMVLYGSNLGNASSHDPRNLPILLFGGGFKHGQYL